MPPKNSSQQNFDALLIGAGASGLFCARTAAQQGARIALFDHNARAGEKIRIAGGGKANFTNLHMDATYFIGSNTAFCRSVLARYQPDDILAFFRAHTLAWKEREHGQLFCVHEARELVDCLVRDCLDAGCTFFTGDPVPLPFLKNDQFVLQTAHALCAAPMLVLATGNVACPQCGATDYSLRVAKTFGHRIQPPRPVLVPLVLASDSPFLSLAGISLPVRLEVDGHEFLDPLLFTHKGISGPAVLQASCYWQSPLPVRIDFLPHQPLETLWDLPEHRKSTPHNVLSRFLPDRLARILIPAPLAKRKIAEIGRKDKDMLHAAVHQHILHPLATAGMRKAEAAAGGVDTRDLNRDMESTLHKGLFILGEAVDITGMLGGYNLHWAWATGHAAGNRIATQRRGFSK